MPLIHVTIARGRSPERKLAMLRAISDAVHEELDAHRDSIRVWITEVSAEDFLVGQETLADKQARLASDR